MSKGNSSLRAKKMLAQTVDDTKRTWGMYVGEQSSLHQFVLFVQVRASETTTERETHATMHSLCVCSALPLPLLTSFELHDRKMHPASGRELVR